VAYLAQTGFSKTGEIRIMGSDFHYERENIVVNNSRLIKHPELSGLEILFPLLLRAPLPF